MRPIAHLRFRQILTLLLTTTAMLLLMLSGSASSAAPQSPAVDAPAGFRAQRTGTPSSFDKTATARARRAGDRDRNLRFIPTAVLIAESAELAYGPESGEITGEEDDFIEEYCADVDFPNFVLTVRFFNPQGLSQWDYGVIFRKDEFDYYNLIVTYIARWGIALFKQGEALDFSNFGTGSVPNMDRGRRGFNDLTLIVEDELGMVIMNGEYLTPVKLRDKLAGGEICLATETFWSRDGSTLSFENFAIYELP
jgi:hypothetical protein